MLQQHVDYWRRSRLNRPRRYRALFRTIHRYRCRRIVEIGVYDGVHALQMIQTAALRHSPSAIDYYGFDLFEDLTDSQLESEFSKRASSMAAIRTRLEHIGANIHLFKGDSRITLPAATDRIGEVDFVFIDGGHSIDTIRSDWSGVQRLMGKHTRVIFDDYYMDPSPELDGLGCQKLIDHLDRHVWEVSVFEPIDAFRKEWGQLRIRMAMVKRTA